MGTASQEEYGKVLCQCRGGRMRCIVLRVWISVPYKHRNAQYELMGLTLVLITQSYRDTIQPMNIYHDQ